MVLAKRIIPCLDVANGRVVKGLNFESIKDAGDPVQLAEKYVPSAVGIASALNIAAFNVGIAIGALVGGLIVDSIGLIHTPWIGGVMVFGAVLLTMWSSSLERKLDE